MAMSPTRTTIERLKILADLKAASARGDVRGIQMALARLTQLKEIQFGRAKG
jgi:hypothetical protein